MKPGMIKMGVGIGLAVLGAVGGIIGPQMYSKGQYEYDVYKYNNPPQQIPNKDNSEKVVTGFAGGETAK